MRRTISTLMFLAVGGLALAAHAQDSASNSYYAAGSSTYRISDEDDDDAPAAKTHTTGVATAVGQPQQAGQEKNALYVSDRSGLSGELLQTNYFEAASSTCGSNNACGCKSGNSCNNNCGCLSDCCNCDCATNSFRFEYLVWFSRGRNTPALVTTSPGGTARADAGVLGLADTTILYGDDRIGTDIRNGGRLTLSHLFNDGCTYGDVRFWGVEDSSETFTADNSGPNSIIARPFFNAGLGIEDSFLVAFPGVTDPGSIRVLSKNDLIGADAWLRRNWYDDGCLSVDILGGYQFTRLDDSIAIASTSTVAEIGGTLPVGTEISIFDSFRTQNEFHGGSAGIIARSDRGAVTLEGLFKVGLGNMRQRVTTNGVTTLNGTAPSTGGLLAQPTNIGTFERNRFAFSPELNLNVVYNVNESWRLVGGYSFVYWSDVVLAGNQIDRSVNLSQVPGPIVGAARPGVKFQETDFWVQGISTGAEYRW